MYAFKDKVSNQLSRFFADSPNHNPLSPSDRSQGMQYSSEGKSFSSYFSLPYRSFNFGGSGSKRHQHGFNPIQGGKDFNKEDEYSVKYQECNIVSEDEDYFKITEDGKEGRAVCTKNQTSESNDCGSGRSSNGSDVFEEAREQPTPRSPLCDLMDESAFISPELYEFLHSSLPNNSEGLQMDFGIQGSTLKDGISLRTLIRKSADFPGPCILVVGDRQGAVFGGLLDCPLRPTPKRKYQGTNQSFVFTTIYGEPRLFRPTGANRYYYMCLNDLLALGGGSHFALSLDGDLLNGSSGPCETYGNMCLANKPDFELKNVELWGFTHSSKYRT